MAGGSNAVTYRYLDGRGKEQPIDHNARYWINWGDNFSSCRSQLDRAGIVILNASPTSTVKAFPKISIDEGFKCLIDGRRSG